MRRFAVLLLLVGCRQLLGFEDPSVMPSDGPAPDVMVDAPIGCTTASSCPANVPICLDEICVECTAADTSACPSTEPFCGLDNQCRGCISNADCESTSDLCLANGTCADPALVAYVAQGATGDCSKASPCGLIQVALDTTRPIFRVTGTVAETSGLNLNRSVDIYGTPGAAITKANNGQLMDVNNNANVAFYGIMLKDVTGHALRINNGSAFLDTVLIANNGGLGIDARNGTTVTMRRSIVFNNDGGGALFNDATISVTNCLFVGNGSATSAVGGVRIKPTASLVFELNTIADNTIDALGGSPDDGVRCDAAFAAHSNIVVGDALGNPCTFDHSLFDGVETGTGNVMGLAKFLSTTSPTALDFYRIGPDSDAINGAISTITFDIDGQTRPTGGAPDMGADERP